VGVGPLTAPTRRRRVAAAVAFGAGIIVSAPFAQQLFMQLSERWPEQLDVIGFTVTAIPAAVVGGVALWRIRDRYLLRYSLAVLGIGLGAAYILRTDLSFAEAFHFAEYGLLAILFYRVWTDLDDWAIVALPLVAGALVGTLDEWVQWFIPIRAGEMRDVVINVVATSGGLLLATAIDTPRRLRFALERRSRVLIAQWAAITMVAFALFFYCVHVGYDIHDPEIGSFRSNFTATELASAAQDRAARWRQEPPSELRLLWREDHYLTEALWHVQQRDLAWEAGDVSTAWRENRMLEKYFAPVLETTTYADPAGHRWPAAQRADAAARLGDAIRPRVTLDYIVPLYAWPDLLVGSFNSR
jgi:hypothetical protein